MTNIAFITGGSGARGIAREMARRSVNTAHIIGVADSGRSTRQLRQMFNMPAIGDLRSRLIDLADIGTPGYREVAALLKHRLPAAGKPLDLEDEVMSICFGGHPLLEAIPNDLEPFATIIATHIREFDIVRRGIEARIFRPFDFRQASIGNLFLTGAYLHYRSNLEAAIFLYKQLANVRGEVIPACLAPNLNLVAEYADGLAEAVRESSAVKVFVTNTLRDAETGVLNSAGMAWQIVETLRRLDSQPSSVDEDYLQTQVLGNFSFVRNQALALVDVSELLPCLETYWAEVDDQTAHYQPDRLADGLLGMLVKS